MGRMNWLLMAVPIGTHFVIIVSCNGIVKI